MDSDSKIFQVAALDIGTSKISLVVADCNRAGTINIVGLGKVPSSGVSHGSVRDVGLVVDSIRRAIHDAQETSQRGIERVSVALTGRRLRSINGEGRLVLGEGEITQRDLTRAVNLAIRLDPRAAGLDSDDRVVSQTVKYFRLDGDDTNIEDPVGMTANVLRAYVHMVVGEDSTLANLVRCVRRAGLEVDNLVLQPWASAISCLTRTERELGAIVMDMGAGTTDLVCFQNGHIEQTTVVPDGGDLVTNDIAVALRCSIRAAEEIKLAYGHTGFQPDDHAEKVQFQNEVTGDTDATTRDKVVEPIDARYREILSTIRQRYLEPGGWTRRAAAGIVLCGGCAALPGLREMVEREIGLATRIGAPQLGDQQLFDLSNPPDAAAIGVLLETIRRRGRDGQARGGSGRMNAAWGAVRRFMFGDFYN